MISRRLVLLAVLTSCGGQPSSADVGAPDAGVTEAGACFMRPTTHLELINACTTATAIVRRPILPLLRADGGVPPLP
jgi:hypothetical protein